MEGKNAFLSSAALSSAETLHDGHSTLEAPKKLAGDHEKPENVVPTLTAAEVEHQPPRVFKRSACRRCLTSLADGTKWTAVLSAFSNLSFALGKTFGGDLKHSTKAQANINMQIEEDLARLKEEKQREKQVLVLGAADEVSAIFSQIETQNARGYSIESRQGTINELYLDNGSSSYRLIDVHKLTTRGRKWLHRVDYIATVLFVVDVSSYSDGLLEESPANRLREALALFDSVFDSRYFNKVGFVLLFNKVDRFREKIQLGSEPISKWFPKYCGSETDVQAGLQFFADMFTRAHRVPDRKCHVLYTHSAGTEILETLDDCMKEIAKDD